MSTSLDLILDDNGRVWRTGSRDLMASLHVSGRGRDLTRYLVQNLGFVRLQVIRQGVRITLRPRFLTKEAYEALVFQMVTLDSGRFMIEVVDVPSRIEILPGVEDAAARLADLASTGGHIVREDFYCQELSTRRLRDDPRLAPLAAVLRRWKRDRGVVGCDFDTLFADPALRGRNIVKRMTDGTEGIYEYVGDGFPSYDAGWRRAMLGNGASGQPDPRYSRRGAPGYLETHASQTPRLELIDAAIRVPGYAAYRRRYERLLLPWRRGGMAFVSVTSVLRTSLALPSDV